MQSPRCLAWLVGLAACRPAPQPSSAPPHPEVLSCLDLPPGDPRSHNLSGLAWDGHQLISISDRDRQLAVLAPDASFTHVALQPAIPLEIPLDAWDAEAVVLAGDRFFVVANETRPAVFSVDRTGHDATPIALPPFPGIRDNRGLESLGFFEAPGEAGGARYLFAANEQALDADGPLATPTAGTVIRILRHALPGGPDLEVAYRTEPVSGAGLHIDNGVSDLVPLDADRVLVVERGWVEGIGNTVRVYEVDLRTAPSALGVADARTIPPAAKRLVVDLATLPDDRCPPARSPQPNRNLENYEGIALGPLLPDHRRVVFLLADDNGGKAQAARLLTLSLPSSAL